MGRSGWGTGWQALNLGKPWLVTPYVKGDDPEIYFNNQTVLYSGIGKVLYSEFSIYKFGLLKAYIAMCTNRIQHVRKQHRDTFDTLDGIAYVGKKIVLDYLEH